MAYNSEAFTSLPAGNTHRPVVVSQVAFSSRSIQRESKISGKENYFFNKMMVGLIPGFWQPEVQLTVEHGGGCVGG